MFGEGVVAMLAQVSEEGGAGWQGTNKATKGLPSRAQAPLSPWGPNPPESPNGLGAQGQEAS